MNLTIVNAICNIVISGSMTAFMVFAFGRNSLLYKLPDWERIMVKVGLAGIAAGSFFNFLTLSTPVWTEVLLNVGLAVTFIWAAFFHYHHFIKVAQKKSRKQNEAKWEYRLMSSILHKILDMYSEKPLAP